MMNIHREALEIDGHNAFKDSYSKAIVSSDSEALSKHRAAKRRRKQEYDDKMKMQNELIELRCEIGELKSIMIEIIKSKQN